MKTRLILAIATLAALIVPTLVLANVTVLVDVPIIQEIGTCCNPNGDPADPLTCLPGQDPKCGWMGGTSEGNKYNPPVPITAFEDAVGAHEEVGTITVECDSGQIAGDFEDKGDFDIPGEVFYDGYDIAGPNYFMYSDPITTPAAPAIQVPASGKWTDFPCSGECAIRTDSDFVTKDGTLGFWFYNYGYDPDSAAATPATAIDRIECFRSNPGLPGSSAAGLVYATGGVYAGCAAGVPCGLTLEGCEVDPVAPANPLWMNDWVAGTIVDVVLPYGVRLSNTLYPGILLEGKNQFDLRYSGTQNGNFSWRYAAVVFRWEANHRLTGYGANGNLPLPSATYDRIKIFVPDILEDVSTDSGTPSSFVLGEDLYVSSTGRIPAARDLVQQCYGGPLGGYYDPTLGCNYDTTICVDIRGADPAYRAVDPISRYVKFSIEDPLGTTYTPAVFEIAILRLRSTTGVMSARSYPEALPNCDGYSDCYWYRVDGTGVGVFEPDSTDPGLLYVAWEEAIGAVEFTEPQGNYIQVDMNASTSMIVCTLTDPTHVQFVEFDMSGLTTCPLLCRWEWTMGLAPAGVNCDQINTGAGINAMVEPIGNSMMVTVADVSDDQIVVQILTESGPNSPATITIGGYNLLIDDRALPGGIGCIEMECELFFPVSECSNHVGVANTDTGDTGNPNQSNVGAAPLDHRPGAAGGGEAWTLPITCIVPGRTVLLYPYLVRAVGFDSGLVVTNTAGSEAIVHFYLYEEGGRTNIDTNPDLSVLQQADPKRLVKGVDALYDEYIEIPRYGQYVNLVFEYPGDPLTGVPKHECGSESASGIFSDATYQDLCTDMGRVWIYAVVEQCYSHGYQMVFSENGFGSTLALVDQDTSIEPFTDAHISSPRDALGVTSGTRFLPVHTPPSRYHNNGNPLLGDSEYRVYRYWNGNNQ